MYEEYTHVNAMQGLTFADNIIVLQKNAFKYSFLMVAQTIKQNFELCLIKFTAQ